METVYSWHDATLGERVITALEKRGFDAIYFPNRDAAVKYLVEQIPAHAAVGVGGSMTVQEIEILPILKEQGNEILDHNDPSLTDEKKMEYRRRQLSCDVFLTSTNALTLDGQLINVDGAGNRVAAMIFGPQKVFIIAGMNKVAQDLDSAMERIQIYAAPMNNKRLNRPNPCATTGLCMDCQGSTRICNVTTIMHRKPMLIAATVVLIGESLGY